MQGISRGFTLIELMIVLAIIAILIAIAVPTYQDYAARTKVGEAIYVSAPPKLAVSETFLSDGVLPADNAAAGYSFAPSTYVASVTITNGVVVTVTQSTGCQAGTPTLTFTPDTTIGSAIDWSCSSSPAGVHTCVPSECR